MSTTNENKTNEEKKEEYVGIVVKEPIAFTSTLDTNLTTTQKLCGVINGLFRPALADYVGCIITIVPNGSLGLVLYFKDTGNASREQIKCLNKKDSDSSITDKLNRINNMVSRRRVYDLTTSAKKALEEFFDVPKVNWGNAVSELTANVNHFNNKYDIYCAVSGLSLNKVLRKIYGSKDEDGREVQYDTKIMRPMDNDMYNFIISVMRLNNDLLQSFATEIGMINNPIYSFPIVPANC